jgi:hypothetical protein
MTFWRSLAVVPWVFVVAVNACGDDSAAGPGSGSDAGTDGPSIPPNEAGVIAPFDAGPVPPVSGAMRWYADIHPAHTFGNGIAVARDGRVALAFSPVTAGTVADTPFTHFGPGTSTPNYDVLVGVVNNAGKLAWQRSFATAEIEAATAAAFDEAGDLYVSGTFKNNADGLDFGTGVTVGIGPGEISSFLVKLRGTDGTPLWAASIEAVNAGADPSCGLGKHELAVRAGRVALACVFDAGVSNTRSARVVVKGAPTSVPSVAARSNALLIRFDANDGKVTSTYVMAGAGDEAIHAVRLTEGGDVVFGATLKKGSSLDSAGSAPLPVSIAQTCLIGRIPAGDAKPSFRRTFEGDVAATCTLRDVAVVENQKILFGGAAKGNVDFGDSVTGADDYGTFGAVNAVTGANAGVTLERFPGETVFGVDVDAWGQSFVGVYGGTASKAIFRYTKRDASGAIVFTSKSVVPDSETGSSLMEAFGLGVDGSGSLTVFGDLKGTFTFPDGVARGQDGDQHFFAARFDP